MSELQRNFLLHELMALSQDCVNLPGAERKKQHRETVDRTVPAVQYKEAHVTAEIRKRQQRGESLSAIARALNRDGLRGAYGGRWYAASVYAFIGRRSHET